MPFMPDAYDDAADAAATIFDAHLRDIDHAYYYAATP